MGHSQDVKDVKGLICCLEEVWTWAGSPRAEVSWLQQAQAFSLDLCKNISPGVQWPKTESPAWIILNFSVYFGCLKIKLNAP